MPLYGHTRLALFASIPCRCSALASVSVVMLVGIIFGCKTNFLYCERATAAATRVLSKSTHRTRLALGGAAVR